MFTSLQIATILTIIKKFVCTAEKRMEWYGKVSMGIKDICIFEDKSS